MNVLADILQAEQRIRSYVRETPLEYSWPLSALTGSQVFLKLENLQYTGSFKLRGAMNALLTLTPEQRARGIVTASSGNHGHAVAFGLHSLNVPGVIFVPEGTSSTKITAIRHYGADLRIWGDDSVKTEGYARAYAAQQDMVYISPYNDRSVIGGQGTIGVELCRQSERIDVVLAALGGGGMLTGIAEYVKAIYPAAEIIGCSPEHSPVMARSVQAGRIIEMESLPTLSDGTAGGIEEDALTFPLCQRLIDDYTQVSEEEIRQAMRLCLEKQHMLIEGAAGVALAALLKLTGRFQGKNVIVVLCGANISIETLRTILSENVLVDYTNTGKV
ncbi:MAG TPA: threonine/serine dehydratase [Ktedonobacteraceae bacterium]|nr:threonine/serine dehydratase [Ktedonobacteraceae bacterium]